MTYDDLDTVYEIEKTCYPDPWVLSSFEEALLNYEALVIYVLKENELIGYFIGWGLYDEYEIYNVTIKPEYQNKGYGYYFISSIIKSHNNSFLKYFLEVRKSNKKALSLYKKIGFKYISERKLYYQNPDEDAFVLKYEIGSY